MQKDLDLEALPVEVHILGVNGIGLEVGNPTVTAGRTLPWLQDVPEQNVWVSWNVVWRDVWILDVNNAPITVFNLTEHNLADPVEYAALKTILEDAATP